MSKLMMGFQIIFVLVFFTGIGVKANPLYRCLEMMRFHEEVDTFMKLQNADQVNLFCTNTTHYFTCINDIMKEHTGLTVREMANHWAMKGTESGEFLNFFIKMEDQVEEMCRNRTQLQSDFELDFPCFERGRMISVRHCMGQSVLASLAFVELQPTKEIPDEDIECILTAYQLGCAAATLREECGVEAFNRYKTVIKKAFFRSGTCSSDLKQTLKTTFLESLDMTESRKNVHRAILDLMRRRK